MSAEQPRAEASGVSPVPAAAPNRRRQIQVRATVLAVVVICALPLLAALYLRYVSPPQPAATVGTALAPVALPFEWLQHLDGTPLEHPQVSGKWLLIITAPGRCDDPCQQALYLTRQSRTAQGRNMARVERLWVVTDGVTPAPQLLAAHRDLVVATSSDRRLFEVLGSGESRHIHLVDRRGLLVFRYPYDPDPKAFISELGKLIRH